jgi:hypothetical protein
MMTWHHIAKLAIVPTLLVGTVLNLILWRKLPKGERRLLDPDPTIPVWITAGLIIALVLLCLEAVLSI